MTDIFNIGAAPIIYSIMNGDTVTGVTVMKIRPKHFDIGEIIAQAQVEIKSDMLMPELHEKLSTCGAKLLVESLEQIPDSLVNAKPQNESNVTYGKHTILY